MITEVTGPAVHTVKTRPARSSLKSLVVELHAEAERQDTCLTGHLDQCFKQGTSHAAPTG